MKTVAEQTWELVEPILRHEGFEIVDVEYVREGGRFVLRLFIDKPDSAPGCGVTIDDCQRASEAIETAIEVADLVPNEYALEVSSPGVERPLVRPEHFVRAVGQKVRLRTYCPLFEPPRKNFTGVLLAFEDGRATLEIEGAGTFTIDRKDIAKANLQPDWD